jgi:DNA-binding SARP family transcriptional activator
MNASRIYLLGSFQLLPGPPADEAPLELHSTKLQALLACLILQRNQRMERRQLGRLLWPHADASAARRNLREYLYRARQLLAGFAPGAETLEADEDFVAFAPPPDCWIDVAEFERLTRLARDATAHPHDAISLLRQANDLYRGDLLPSFYDDWVLPERERLRALLIENLAQLGQALHAAGETAEAIRSLQRVLEYDPLQEETHRRLMEWYAAGGDRAKALHQYELCRQLLANELSATPMPETQQVYAAIRRERLALWSVSDRAANDGLPFVGRQAELVGLSQAMSQVRAGQGQTLVIIGDSGAGKTRLVNEWLGALPDDVTALRGQGHEFEQNIPYHPLLDALQQSLSWLPWHNLPPDPTYAWLAPVAQLLPDLYVHLPELSRAAAHPSGAETGHSILEGLAQLFLSFAHSSPLVLFLDDLHWADAHTWQFLAFVARRARRAPLLLIGAFSPPEASAEQSTHLRALEHSGRAQLLPLPSLSLADVAELASHLLNCPVQAVEALAARLHQESRGNPLFATAALTALRESEVRPPYWPAHLDRLIIPGPLQALIENRLDRLEPDSQQALSLAAAIGRAFTFELLAAVADTGEKELLDALEDWIRRGLVVEQTERAYDFAHAWVRDVAYRRLSRPRRQRAHYHIARALERLYPSDKERIAYHYHLSDQPARTGL